MVVAQRAQVVEQNHWPNEGWPHCQPWQNVGFCESFARGTPCQRETMLVMERVTIALIGGVLGFMTGVLAWFVSPQALEIPYSTFLVVSVLLAGVFFALAMLNPDRAVRVLGRVWDGVALINRQVLFWIKLIK